MDNTHFLSEVILIDDQEIDLLIAERILKAAGFADKIITFNTVQSALDYLSIRPVHLKPDAIFTDLEMPVKNGFDFLQAIVDNPQLIKPGCQIYVLSSSVHWYDKEKIKYNTVVSRHFCKPLTVQSLNSLYSA